MSSALADGVDYVVSYGDGPSVSFKASAGKVARIELTTVSAEKSVATPITFVLKDANNVDVTSTVSVDQVMTIDVEGLDDASVTADTSLASKATITMSNVNDRAKVTLKYDDGSKDSAVAPVEGVITCVAATALVGKGRFKVATGSGVKTYTDGTQCAKFYTGSDDSSVAVAVGNSNANLYFFAEDLKNEGVALSYDEYEVTSSNDDVLSANIEGDITSGKFVRINYSGNTVGSANIIIKATKNGVPYNYVIPATVVPVKDIKSISVSATKPTMSNAYDTAYSGSLVVTATYTDNSKSEIYDYASKLTDAKQADLMDPDAEPRFVAGDLGTGIATGFVVDDDEYTAYGAKGNTTYGITVSASKANGDEVSARTNVTVKELDAAAWKLGGLGATLTYEIETASTVKVSKGSATFNLVAKDSSKNFAGYVRQTAGVATIGTPSDIAGAKAVVGTSIAGHDGKYVQLTAAAIGDVITKVVVKPADVDHVVAAGKIATYLVDGTLTIYTGDLDATNAEDVTVAKAKDADTNDISTNYSELVPNAVGTNGNNKVLNSGYTAKTNVHATIATQISGIKTAVKYGNKYYNGSALYGNDEDLTDNALSAGAYGFTTSLKAASNVVYYGSKESTMHDSVARAGTYTPTFYYTMNGENKSATTKVTVLNDFFVPKASYTTRVVNSFSPDDVKEALKFTCDMNCNASTADSLVKLYKNGPANTVVEAVEENGKMQVNYVGITENGVEVVVPLTVTLTTN